MKKLINGMKKTWQVSATPIKPTATNNLITKIIMWSFYSVIIFWVAYGSYLLIKPAKPVVETISEKQLSYCKAYISLSSKNPDSYKTLHSSIGYLKNGYTTAEGTKLDADIARVNYSATNSFGARVQDTVACVFVPNSTTMLTFKKI
jgi:hypothetical protein